MFLVLDNYDSFVHNLARYIRNLGQETSVVRSDAIDVAGCQEIAPTAIIISPGPHRPEHAGESLAVIRELGPTVPILGICLGHQAIGQAFGASITQCGPVHGIATPIRHNGDGLFAGCQNPMEVGRYHSLAIQRSSMPETLIVTAETVDGVIMGVRHRDYPIHGLQFHPESVLTAEGSTTLKNFVSMATSDRSDA